MFYRSIQTDLRKKLRKSMNLSERILWESLRISRLDGFKFRRQAGIGRYIADFYCFQAHLVVEIDGSSHDSVEAKEYDKIRNVFMEDLGLRVLRVSDRDVLTNLPSVLAAIRHLLSKPPPHLEEGESKGVESPHSNFNAPPKSRKSQICIFCTGM